MQASSFGRPPQPHTYGLIEDDRLCTICPFCGPPATKRRRARSAWRRGRTGIIASGRRSHGRSECVALTSEDEAYSLYSTCLRLSGMTCERGLIGVYGCSLYCSSAVS